ncbi:hypothetical protein [Legionella norrlandica]|uniref:hypothetical protein n=1 Tax=Legionella norrlandica TaxID=1498499 RepID=UPI001F4C6727|nr:hypothetical protein [Legionella norrlandica]
MSAKNLLAQEDLTSYVNDLVSLSKRLIPNSTNYSRINSVISIMHLIISEQISSQICLVPDQEASKKSLALYEQLCTLLTEKNYCSTWFTKIIDHCCYDDHELNQRLNNFIQRTIGPVIKLSEFVRDKKNHWQLNFQIRECAIYFWSNLK